MATDARRYHAGNPVDDRYRWPQCHELAEIADVLTDGRLSGGAPVVAMYEAALADYFGAAHAVAVNSGSSALHAALVALGVGPGAEVIVPAIAPLPTALPILTAGATPVIVDVLHGRLALDPADLEQVITRRTKAAIIVPLWGYPTIDNEPAEAVLARNAIPMIEDAAQAHGTRTNGRDAGTIGAIGCFSTHDRKPLSTGEGGFLLTDSPELYERIEHYTRLGHLSGKSHGVNYKLAGPLAAIGLHRLAHLHDQLAARRANAASILATLPAGGPLTELAHDRRDTPNYYNLVLTTGEAAPAVGQRFADAGLPPDWIRYGYRPLYHQPIFTTYARPCPNAEALTASAIQLPTHPGLGAAALEWIAQRVAMISESE